MSKPTGTCPVCNRPYQLKRDGQGKGLPFSDPCDGSGQLPTTTAKAKPQCTCGEGTATLHFSTCRLYTDQLLTPATTTRSTR